MTVPFTVVRASILGVTNAIALLIFALAVYTLSHTVSFYFTYSALGTASALIHMVSVSAMLAVSRFRAGAFSSRISFEVAWLFYLSIMWLSTGAQTAATLNIAILCEGFFCGATRAICAFAFINWLILLGYVMTLLAAVTRARQAGKNLWTSEVKDIEWVPGPAGLEKGIVNTPNPAFATYPPSGAPGSPMMNQSQPVYQQYTGGPQV